MKFTKLLVLGVLALLGVNSAWAEVPDGVWTIPEPQGLEFTTFTDDGTHYYLYNPSTKMFFASGNGWNTQASLRNFGNEVWLQSATEADAPEGSYELWNNNVNNPARSTGNGNLFTDDGDASWCDHGKQANFSWAYEIVGDVVRLQNVALIADKAEFAGKYLGFDGSYVMKTEGSNGTNRNAYTAMLRHVDPATGGADWKAVTVESYEAFKANTDAYQAYVDAIPTYIVGTQLKKALDEAEKIGATVDAELTEVYNDKSSTVDELSAALTKVNEAITARNKELANDNIKTATGANPQDASVWITNGTFDTVGDFTGWSGSGFGAGGTTAPCAERYDMRFDTYQDITVKYPGLYLFGVKGFYRAGSMDNSYSLFSQKDPRAQQTKYYVTVDGDSTQVFIKNIFDGVPTEKPAHGKATSSNGYWIPNSMADADQFFHTDGLYGHMMPVEITGSDVTVRIGVKQEKTFDTEWAIFDDFTLTFFGAGDDRYLGYVNTVAATYPTYAASGLFTQSYLDSYNALKNAPAATDKASAEAYVASLNAAQEAYLENVSLWNQWNTQVEDAAKTYRNNKDANIDIDIMLNLLDYIESEEGFTCKADEIKAAKNLDNEGLKAAMAELKALVDAFELAVKNQIKAGDDVTRFLVNPSFDVTGDAEKGWNGWHKTTNSMPTTGGTDDNKTAEAWSAKEFDLYQEVENAPVGVYEISVQGFYRYGRDDNAYNIFKAQEIEYVKPKSAPVYVYMNDKKTPFKNIYDEESPGQDFYVSMANTDAETGEPLKGATGIYQWKAIPYSVQNYPADAPTMFFPNGMASAAVAFSAGMYTQTATSLVAKQGDKLRLGVKGSTQQPDMTDCWVIWDNFKLTYKGKSAEDVKPVLAEAIEDAKGILIDPETQEEKPIGKDAYETLQQAIASAQAALESNDGAKMFDELAKLVSVNVDASAEKFKSLKAAYLKFEDAVNTAEAADAASKPSDATIAAAWALHDEVMEGMENRTMTDADADAKIKEMEEMTKKLLVPATFDIASDAQPASATFYITNPKYADNADTGWTGGAAVANHEAEMFNKDFDYYQDIEGVKPGTYRLSIQGFYRAGSSVNDFKLFTEAPDSANNAFLYAVTANGTSSAPLKRLASCAIQQTAGEAIPADWAAAKTDTIFNDNGEKVDTILTHTVVVDRMSTAEQVFAKEEAAENYSGTSVVVKVGDDGKLRIGVKKQARIETEWTIWTNWQLTYYGANSTLNVDGDPSGINETRGAAVAKAEYFTIGGAQVSKPGKGVAIVKQTMNDGSVKIQKVIIK